MCKASINYLYIAEERLNIITEIDPYLSMSIQEMGTVGKR